MNNIWSDLEIRINKQNLFFHTKSVIHRDEKVFDEFSKVVERMLVQMVDTRRS